MSFDRTLLPDPLDYYTSTAGLTFLEKRGRWRTTRCEFHGGSDSMRVNTVTGGFACMAGCGARGGDVIAYEMARAGTDFATATKALGAWVDDGKPAPARPTPLSPRSAVLLLRNEINLIGIEAARTWSGIPRTDADKNRFLTAIARVLKVLEIFA